VRKDHIMEENKELLSKVNEYEQWEKESIKEVSIIKTKNEQLENELVSKLDNQKKQYEDRIEEIRKHYEAQIQLFQSNKTEKEQELKQLKIEFENIAQKILHLKAEHYQKESEKSISTLLNPLKERINIFEKKMQDCYEKEGKERHSLEKEIKAIADVAQNFTQVFQSNTKIQGDLGELVLRRVLESSGLREGTEFTVQGNKLNLKNETGGLLKPDVVVHLPDNRNIVIDSKVSLTHYRSYISAKSEEDRMKFVKQIIYSLSQHIDNLSKKEYHNAEGLRTPDFVLMFIPVEGAFSLAIKEEQKLFERAWKKSIAIVSPFTLYATLKTINYLWKIERQHKNAENIAIESGRLYDKFVGFLNDMDNLDKGLKGARDHYDKACNKLHLGQGNLVGKAEKIKQLGARADKSVPQKFLTSADNLLESPSDEQPSKH